MSRRDTRLPPSMRRWPIMVAMAAIAILLAVALMTALGLVTSRPAASQDGAAAPTPAEPWLKPDPSRSLTRIAVGSCLDQRKPQPIWQAVIAARPDLFMMLGDNVYGDVASVDRRELIEAYRTQAAQPEFKQARTAMPFLAIWDDHDFGFNDAGRHFAHRREAADLFRAFWQQPEARGHGEGVYYSRIVGPDGRRVQMIFLDTRTFRSDLEPRGMDFPHWGRYQPSQDPAATMLGPEQWAWLAAELKKPAEIRLVASSIQVLAEGHGFERWGNLPNERRRLLELIATSGAKGVLMLSGDRHVSAIYRDSAARPYPLVEITSSSLNRSYGPSRDTRMAPLVSELYHPENFATLDIDWEARRLVATIRAIDGSKVTATELAFSDLGH